MTSETFTAIRSSLGCPGYVFEEGPLGNGWYLCVVFETADGLQQGRKWYVSPHSTESEVVQTALKALLTAAEHEIRETFRYQGAAVFSPHFNVHDFVWLSHAGSSDRRADG